MVRPGRIGVIIGLAAVGLLAAVSLHVVGNPIPWSPSYPQNPVPYEPSHQDTTFKIGTGFSGVLWLFALNLFVNLAFYSFLLLLLVDSFSEVRRVMPTGLWFILAVIGTVCVITAIGAVVDYYLVMEPRTAIGGVTERFIALDLAKWSAALALIFLSVVAPTVGFFMKVGRSVILGVGFVLINVAWWFFSLELGYDVAFLTIFSSILLTPVLLKILVDHFNAGVASKNAGRSEM